MLSRRIVLPAELPEPFLWELHLSAGADLPAFQLSLAGGPPLQARLFAGRRSEVTGIAARPRRARVRRLEFLLHDRHAPEGVVQFLGLSLLSLQDLAAPSQTVE